MLNPLNLQIGKKIKSMSKWMKRKVSTQSKRKNFHYQSQSQMTSSLMNYPTTSRFLMVNLLLSKWKSQRCLLSQWQKNKPTCPTRMSNSTRMTIQVKRDNKRNCSTRKTLKRRWTAWTSRIRKMTMIRWRVAKFNLKEKWSEFTSETWSNWTRNSSLKITLFASSTLWHWILNSASWRLRTWVRRMLIFCRIFNKSKRRFSQHHQRLSKWKALNSLQSRYLRTLSSRMTDSRTNQILKVLVW